MPQLGESVVDGTILKWLKKEGEQVDEFESLLEVETVKVTSEIPSPATGVLLKILVPEGQTVLARTVLAWIGQPGEVIPDEKGASPAELSPTAVAALEGPASFSAGRKDDLGFISPVVARIARENQLDLSQVKGTGNQGRITKKDVLDHLAGGQIAMKPAATDLPAWETPGSGDLFKPTELLIPHPESRPVPPAGQAPPSTGSDTVIPLTTARKAIADHMVMSKHTSAHVTTVMEADMSRVVADRQKNLPLFERDGIHLTYTPYFISAMSQAIRQYPLVNSSWSDKGIVLHKSIHVGMAVSLGEDGLIVPVIRNADSLSLAGLARAVNDLAERGRNRNLKPDEVVGGTISITNHGTGGSLFATPVINQPQVAIVGIGTIQKRAVVIQDAIAIRPMVYLSLTFDHRVMDGSTADAFLHTMKNALENV
jgi:2-oxoglutarate dehydrogenase E2 component (dihydrolipoamide succinyltransferase)